MKLTETSEEPKEGTEPTNASFDQTAVEEAQQQKGKAFFRLPFVQFGLGLFIGMGLMFFAVFSYRQITGANQALSRTDIEKIDQAYTTLAQGYVKKLSAKQLVNGAIKGMAEATEDPFTQYLNEKETASFSESMDAQFEGIGATLSVVSKRILIMAPIKGSPAEKAGLLPNDEITRVNGQSTDGKSLTDVVAKVRGKKGTPVTLTIKRGSKEQDFKIIRDAIPIQTVNASIDKKHPEVGRIEVTNFSKPTQTELETAIKQLREKGAKRFVLDFRGNPGGLLDQALSIANMFVKNGDNLMQTEDRQKQRVIYKASDQLGHFKVTEPTVLLINGGSASASEIVAAALNESAHVPLIGEKSFGKGTVQTVRELTKKTELKYTISKWLTPNGHWIHRKGIRPTDPVEPSKGSKLLMVMAGDKLEKGKENEEVLNLNLVLRELGYKIPATMTYEATTEEAIKAFQSAHQLSATGKVDEDTAVALTKALRDQLKEQDPQMDAAVKKVLELKENGQ